MLKAGVPALILAPMEGITDAPMRDLQGATGAFTFAVSEFLRVSGNPIPGRVFLRDVPELGEGGRTRTGLPVQVQILGGHPERMAQSAATAVEAGAWGVDINFGCPAPTVNSHDGGATLLKHPRRIRAIVAAIRAAVPAQVPVSAKLRLGWDDISSIDETAAMAAEGGASWVTIHARTRDQGYAPPVYWKPIGRVREALSLPVVANGDIWTLDKLRQCRDETGCIHFMLGRSALADPFLPRRAAEELGLSLGPSLVEFDWPRLLASLMHCSQELGYGVPRLTLQRLKQWLAIASKYGHFGHFDRVKRCSTPEEFFRVLGPLSEGRISDRV